MKVSPETISAVPVSIQARLRPNAPPPPESLAAGAARWHIVYTKPRQESHALRELENQHYICFLPRINLKKIVRGRVVLVKEPLFPRYLFIRLDTITSNWSPIRNTRGVSSLVSFGGRFATLGDIYIEALQHYEQREPTPPFSPGERVEIADGPFAGLDGLYQMTDGDARALVLVEMMRQPQKLSFSIASLRKTS
jgi:transcriptional antiterminator RfaH